MPLATGSPGWRTVLLVGHPASGSRTGAVGSLVAETLTVRPDEIEQVDLAELVPDSAAGGDAARPAALETVTRARVLVVATPVYKAAYTGLLKTFLDGIRAGELEATVVVPVVVTGSGAHGAVADLQLRVVLQALGAMLPVPSFVVEERHLDEAQQHVDDWARRYGPVVDAVAGVLPTEALVSR